MEHKEIKMKVIGVGGAGNNSISLLLEENFPNVELWAANTDYQDLQKSEFPNKILLGKSTEGFGAGGDPLVGKKAAKDSMEEISKAIKDANILIITAGLGGGTGTGATPVIAEMAKDQGILTIVIVTTPFEAIEGFKRYENAKKGLLELKDKCDALIVLSNEKLLEQYSNVPYLDAFKVANTTLKNSIKSIHDIIYHNGNINIDFNDLKQILSNSGQAIIALGRASGKERATKSVENAFENILSDNKLENYEKMILFIQTDYASSLDDIKKTKDKVNEIFNVNDKTKSLILGIQNIETKETEDFYQVFIIASGVNPTSKLLAERADQVTNNHENNINQEVIQIVQKPVENKLEEKFDIASLTENWFDEDDE